MTTYQFYQAQADFVTQMRGWANTSNAMLRSFYGGTAMPYGMKQVAAGFEMLARAGVSHTRPSYKIASIQVGDREVPVVEEVADATPFATLVHFKKPNVTGQPRVLIVAPMSGHFSTLLRGTVRTMLTEHDVYLVDWSNARDVPTAAGRFGNDEYVDHVIRFLERIGPGGHVVAVCQPCVPVLAAVAIMAEDGNAAQPRSMTLMAGPIDARLSPTAVNVLAMQHAPVWFENLTTTVPGRFRGANRNVYPGFLQLAAFVSMNQDRHVKAHYNLYKDIVAGNDKRVAVTSAFYDEYFAVADLPAEFFLETVKTIFQTFDLARGEMTWRGRRVNPGAIAGTSLLTVEGERDDVCGIGQTMAAHDLCTAIPADRKTHYLQAGVGHYGVFSGARWNNHVYPKVESIIREAMSV